MARRAKQPGSGPVGLGDREYPPVTTPEAREDQLIMMAYDLAEQRMRNGTASSQEVVHFLRLGSSKDRLEREIMGEQKKLVSAKTGSYETGKRLEALYDDAIKAMRTYSGAIDDGSSDQILQ